MTSGRATAVGFCAILMWGLLAPLSKMAGDVPALQLLSMCFAIGGLVGVASWPFRPQAIMVLTSQKWQVWGLNVGALFGCHFLYFLAVRNAPVVEVSLIAYLWPLFIVVFSAIAPGEHLRWYHLVGVVLGLVGTFLVITKGQSFSVVNGLQPGHIIAVPYAILWAGFSVLIRRYGDVPSDIVAGFCAACAALSGICHFLVEPTLWPLSQGQWGAIIALGVLPMGLAFYAWDFGMKRGDRIVLGAASYLAPLLSTVILIGTGFAAYHWSVAVGCALIIIGAFIAAKNTIFKRTI